jgi:hypothetical protein
MNYGDIIAIVTCFVSVAFVSWLQGYSAGRDRGPRDD